MRFTCQWPQMYVFDSPYFLARCFVVGFNCKFAFVSSAHTILGSQKSDRNSSTFCIYFIPFIGFFPKRKNEKRKEKKNQPTRSRPADTTHKTRKSTSPQTITKKEGQGTLALLTHGSSISTYVYLYISIYKEILCTSSSSYSLNENMMFLDCAYKIN